MLKFSMYQQKNQNVMWKKMKIKKYLIFLIILFIILNVACINAADNNTTELELNNKNTLEIDENTQTSLEDNILSQNLDYNQTPQQEILTQNQQEDLLSDFSPYGTKITLTINDTSDFETSGNITVNMHFSFSTPFIFLIFSYIFNNFI